MRRGAQLKEAVAQPLDMRFQPLNGRPVLSQQVTLVGGDELRTGGQLLRPGAKLGIDGLKILNGVPPLASGDVDEVDQQPAAVNVPQEIVSEARALAGALNDAGDVRHDEAGALSRVNHAEIGKQRCEMVVGDLRVGLADHTEQRRFSYVGKPQQPHVRQKLQLQHQFPVLTGQAGLGKARYLPRRRGEMLVAPAAAPAAGDHEGRVVAHVVKNAPCRPVPDQGAAGDLDRQ